MKIRGVLVAAVAALVVAAPASALRWLEDPPPPPPGHTINVPGDITVEATGASTDVSYTVTVTPDEPVSCDGPSSFPVGTTTVHCTADDADPKSFDVTVKDTTPPNVTPPPGVAASTTDPSGTAVSYGSASATDLVDGSVAATCSPASGTTFPVGATPVTCTATDSHGNSGSAGFTVTVTFIDNTAPTFTSVPGPMTLEATSSAGAVATFAVTATDNSGVPPIVSCNPGSGSTFGLGTNSVTCTATDGSSNAASTSFSITVQDTTKPTLNLPGNITVEADSSAGKVVTYSASASDAVAGSVQANCTPASGSTFPIGTTTVNCTANDGHNEANGSFQVTVTDASGPAFSAVPGTITAEANGPNGAVVNYTTPTAVDTVDGPQLVSCSPASHTLFPLGSTTVHCTAADNHGNNSAASFQVAVVDTTPPTIAVPGPTTIYATTPTGIPETAQALLNFRAAVTADDIVDPHPFITDNLGSFAEVGTHDVGFVAHDASGNTRGKSTQLTVLPMPPAGTPPLPTPPPAKLPPDVSKLQVFPGDGFVRLVWGAVTNAANYLVYRSETGARRLSAEGHGDLVYKGTATTYTDRGLKNGVEYRYVVVAQDAAGNQSAGVGSSAVPHLNLLRSPKDGARVKAPPKLLWKRNAEASYYNVQLFRGEQKILSTWPVGASLKLKRTWKYQGKRYTLKKGVYRWYVWPGFGARANVDYGELLGSNSFQMTR